MTKLRSNHVFTSESVSEGHPDKLCDQISDSVLDACLKADPASRVACECLATTGRIIVAGEITTKAQPDYAAIARETARSIGYTSDEVGLDARQCEVQVYVHTQSPDISQGVTADQSLYKEQGAGDQGMMFGYATDETPEFMPAPLLYAHKIVQRLAELRKTQPEQYRFLRPDGKSQVSIRYIDGVPQYVDTVVVSHQHSPDLVMTQLEELVRQVTAEVIPASLRSRPINYLVNPTGRFVVGGPHGDCGLTGRKIIVDTYGGVGSHGGGAFSGKDPSKVDRSAAYMCRYIAKNIVAAKLAKRCEVQVAYAIGYPKPVSINVDTYGTAAKGITDERLQDLLAKGELFDLRPARLIAMLGLTTPFAAGWCYRQTAAYGHFGRAGFPWEKTDRVADLQAAAKKLA